MSGSMKEYAPLCVSRCSGWFENRQSRGNMYMPAFVWQFPSYVQNTDVQPNRDLFHLPRMSDDSLLRKIYPLTQIFISSSINSSTLHAQIESSWNFNHVPSRPTKPDRIQNHPPPARCKTRATQPQHPITPISRAKDETSLLAIPMPPRPPRKLPSPANEICILASVRQESKALGAQQQRSLGPDRRAR